MTPEILTLLGVGIALGGLIVGGQRSLRNAIRELQAGMSQLESRMARLEGLFEGHVGITHHQSNP